MRIVISGQMPPPIGGQNLNVKRFYDILDNESDISVAHWRMEFTKDVKAFRKVGFSKLIELVKVVLMLIKLRSQGKIDVILYSTGGPHTVPIIRDIILLPIACLFSHRVWVHFQAAGIAEKLPKMNFLLRHLLMWVHSICYGGLALSEYGKVDPRALNMKKIEVLPNGLEDVCGLDVLECNECIKKSEINILYVGHICEDKGVPALIKAFGQVCNQNKNLTLYLVGECLTPYTNDLLNNEIEGSGVGDKIKVVGLRVGNDLHQLYKDADFLVFPSVAPYESFGLVLVEAMIWSLPIVASDWRASSEVIGRPPGGICYSINGDHSGSLEKALEKMLASQSEWTRWGQINRTRYEQHYSISCLRNNLISILQSS